MKRRECIVCGAPATLWCDYPLGWTRDLGRMRRESSIQIHAPSHAVRQRYRIQHSCDADLCRNCGSERGHWHARMRSGRGDVDHAVGRGIWDTVDFCPGHEGNGQFTTETTVMQILRFRARWREVARLRQVGDQMGLFEGLLP